MAAIKRFKLDIIVSDLVRERAGWCCESCGMYFPEGSRQALHCSHYYSRAIRATRWHPWNLFSHCAVCHEFYEKRPANFSEWVAAQLGERIHNALMTLAGTPLKLSARQKEGLYRYYVNEYARMCQARMDGDTNRIEFMFPDPIPEAEPRKRKRAKKVSKFKRKVNGSVVLRGAKVDGKRDERAA